MKTAEHITGLLITPYLHPKYKFIDGKLIAEIVRDTLNIILDDMDDNHESIIERRR